MDLVSIITPVYNSEKYLPATIESVLNQIYSNWEWILVDDCSNDNSIKVIESIVDERIKLIKLTENKGAAEARNQGISEAKGKFITFLDSDDVWMPHFLESVVNFLLQEKETFVYASYKRYDENLNPYLADFIAEDFIDFNRLLYNCPMPMLTSIYDASKIGKVEIPKVELREDHALWFEVLKRTQYARAIKEPLAIYRIRRGSVSRNKFFIARKQFMVYYDFLGLSLPKSLYYTFCWAINGMKKYGKI